MPTLQIPQHLEEELQIAAEHSGRSKEEVATEILGAHFEEGTLSPAAFAKARFIWLKQTAKQDDLPPYTPVPITGKPLSATIIEERGER